LLPVLLTVHILSALSIDASLPEQLLLVLALLLMLESRFTRAAAGVATAVQQLLRRPWATVDAAGLLRKSRATCRLVALLQPWPTMVGATGEVLALDVVLAPGSLQWRGRHSQQSAENMATTFSWCCKCLQCWGV
jgi:hypothetical protein